MAKFDRDAFELALKKKYAEAFRTEGSCSFSVSEKEAARCKTYMRQRKKGHLYTYYLQNKMVRLQATKPGEYWLTITDALHPEYKRETKGW